MFFHFLLILNTFIPKRQKNNISQHLFSHWLCLISILLNIQSNFKYSLRTSNFSPYKKKSKGGGGMYIFHNLYSSGMKSFDRLWHNTATDDLPKKGRGRKLQIVQLCFLCIKGWQCFTFFSSEKKKEKNVWLFDQIAKKIENISTNPDSAILCE